MAPGQIVEYAGHHQSGMPLIANDVLDIEADRLKMFWKCGEKCNFSAKFARRHVQ